MRRPEAGAPRPRITWRRLDGILLLDKPYGVSSNTALQRARRLFRADKAGHTGNLDPLATGLLPICFGEATKLSGLLLDANKRYRAMASFGARTATGDIEGPVVETSSLDGFNWDRLPAALKAFEGPQRQVPPMYSALKHQGRPLYELARAGEEIVREPRNITIHALQLLGRQDHLVELDVPCSKGTYIRTLVEDVARSLGQCAHLAGLHRLEAGPFGARPLWTLEALEALDEPAREACLEPMLIALQDWPRLTADAEQLHGLMRGRVIPCAAALPLEADIAVVDEAGALKAVARLDGFGGLAPKRWLGGQAVPSVAASG